MHNDTSAAGATLVGEEQAPEPAQKRRAVPPPPQSLEEAGLSEEFVAGLILKALHVRGSAMGFDLVDMLALPMALLDDVLRHLQERQFVEIRSTEGPRRGEYTFRLTGAGRSRAAEELEISRYVGAAPVPFDDFAHWVAMQSVEGVSISEEQLREAFDGLVVTDPMLEQLGPALNSGRSLFLFGEPGNGKTLLADKIAEVFGETYYVPYAVLLEGTVMVVHDEVHHGEGATEERSPDDEKQSILRDVKEHDRRFAEARRPVVVTGGELTLSQLDLRWDPSGRMYQAPPQLKAAGGVLVVDDLGRQRVPVADLLNRWVVPLEQRQDYLTLRSGKKLIVPFDCFVVFSTNLEPRSLADEAFLRRIQYKIKVPNPERPELERIFEYCCKQRGIEYSDHAVQFLYDEIYTRPEVGARRCHPRDVLDHLTDLASYRGVPATLDVELLAHACHSYFLPSP